MTKSTAKRILNCTMAFECPREWSALEKSPDPNVRHCHQCQRQVTFCTSQDQLDDLAAKGECVAFQASPVRQLMGSVAPKRKQPIEPEDLRKFIDSL